MKLYIKKPVNYFLFFKKKRKIKNVEQMGKQLDALKNNPLGSIVIIFNNGAKVNDVLTSLKNNNLISASESMTVRLLRNKVFKIKL